MQLLECAIAFSHFTSNAFYAAVHSVMATAVEPPQASPGSPIKSTTNGPPQTVDPFGNNLKKLRGALGGGTTRNHNSIVNLLSYWLARVSVPHRGGMQGKPNTCKDIFKHVRCDDGVGEERQRALQEIIPDIVIDGRFLNSTLSGIGVHLLGGIETLVDVKTKSCDDRYPAEASGNVGSVVEKRQEGVNTDYQRKVRKLDEEQGTTAGEQGPFTKKLHEYGRKGRVVAPVIGAFGEVSSDTYAISDLVASALAAEHCSYFADQPSSVKAMFTERLYRSVGLTAHLGWARLLVDRFRDLVELPVPSRQASANTHFFTMDDEDAYEHESYMNPENPHHTH